MSPDELKKTNLNNLASAGVINADSLSGSTAFKPVTPTQTSVPDVSYSGLLDSLTNQETQANAQVQALEKQNTGIQSKTTSLMERLGLRSATQQQKEQQLGVQTLSADVNKYRTNLANLEGQAATMRERVTEANRATGRSGYDLNLIESGAQRTNAIDRISTASLLQAAQGNLADARAEAERATNLEFEPKEAQLKMLQQQLADNKDMLTRYDSKATAALEKKLDIQFKQLQEQKETAKEIRGMALEAAKNQAPADVVAAVGKAKDFNEAFSAIRGYLTNPNDILQSKLLREQILTQQSNRAVNNLEAMIKRAQAGDPRAAAALGLDPQDQNKVRLTVKEAVGVQKDMSNDDNLKAINKSMDTWRALKAYEGEVSNSGAVSVLSPIARGKSQTAYQTAVLNAKEYFNLGVLNGPDQAILQEVLPSNQTYTPFAPFRATTVQNGINNLKSQLADKLDNDYLTVSSRFSNYDKKQVPQLADMDRRYIQTKMEIDPSVAAFVNANPDMPVEDVIKVINNRL